MERVARFPRGTLSDALRSLGRHPASWIGWVEIPHATSEMLEALYNARQRCFFLRPFRRFGWPIAKRTPVVALHLTDREPMAEVPETRADHDVEDEAGFAADLLRLANPANANPGSAKALENETIFFCAHDREILPSCIARCTGMMKQILMFSFRACFRAAAASLLENISAIPILQQSHRLLWSFHSA